MEQHPVPQNVTTFQFRLVGDMTLKQFGYLAAGVLLAYISSKLPLPFFFTWPMMLFFGIGGFGLAFVPIEERPMDIWIASFLRNTYNPTQYVWQKTAQTTNSARPLPVAPVPPHPLAVLPTPKRASLFSVIFSGLWPSPGSKTKTPRQSAQPPTQTLPAGNVDAIARLFQHKPSQAAHQATTTPTVAINQSNTYQISPTIGTDLLSPIKEFFNKLWGAPQTQVAFNNSFARPVPNTPDIKNQQAGIRPIISPVLLKPSSLPQEHQSPQAPPHSDINSAATQAADTQKVKQNLDFARKQNEQLGHELERVKKQADITASVSHVQPKSSQVPMSTPSATIRTIAGDVALGAGIPKLTTFPNIVTGIVKDEKGNLLPGALVTVRDMHDIPLRALKTNRLGQFAASTPLPVGTYLIEIEDPMKRYAFDRAQITVNNTVIPAIEMHAKTQKQVNRDNLAKVIFGDQTS